MRASHPHAAGEALGVRYVLQGSVRRSGNNLRVSAELVDVLADHAIWTETYDRQFNDGFEVQDEIIEAIITALDVKLLSGEQAAVWHKTLKDRDALEVFYKGVQEFFKLRKDAILRARRFFEKVDRKQPNVAIGATWVAMCYWFDAFKAWGDDPAQSLERAGEWADKAVSMEDADGQAHMVLSHIHLMNRRFDDALLVGREAVALRPNCTNANGFFANVLHYCGEQSDAAEHVRWAIRYSPVYPPFFADVLALAYLFDDLHDAALAVARESARINPAGTTARLVEAAAHSATRNVPEAKEAAVRVTAADPTFSLERFAKQQPYRRAEDLNGFIARLRSAGLPC
jgi:tetratricopeptide (TPR) repeat protein